MKREEITTKAKTWEEKVDLVCEHVFQVQQLKEVSPHDLVAEIQARMVNIERTLESILRAENL